MKTGIIKNSLIITLLFFATTASAETPEEKGLAIAVEADKRDTGFSDSTSNMVMTLSNKQGDKSVRNIRIKTLEVT